MLQSSANGLYYSVFNLSFFISIELYVVHPYLLYKVLPLQPLGFGGIFLKILDN